MERLGLGPDACLARNPRLVFGRVTGWGQTGPLAQSAGHDVNYIALTGALNAIGRRGQPPAIPPAYLGDFAGGGMFLVTGVLAALIEAGKSGKGQVVDAAIVDGTAALGSVLFGMAAAGQWNPQRGTNVLDSGAHYYNVYECEDGGWISAGPIEARFYRDFLTRLGIKPETLGDQLDPDNWPAASERLAAVFRTRTRDEWTTLFEGTDACVAPVLDFTEAPHHPHLQRAGPLSKSTASCNPHRHPASAAHRRPRQNHRAIPMYATTQRRSTGGSRPHASQTFARSPKKPAPADRALSPGFFIAIHHEPFPRYPP